MFAVMQMEGKVENFAEMMAGSLGLTAPWYVERAFFDAEEMATQMKEAAETLMRHRDKILSFFKNRLTNAICEGINSTIQAAKRKARGFHTFEGLFVHDLSRCRQIGSGCP